MKEFLRQHEVDFEAVEVGATPDALEEIRAHTGGPVGTPTVVIGGEARIGFDAGWIAQRLELGSTPR